MRVIILKEKHGTRYINASSDKKLYQACMAIVNQRVDAKFYSHIESPIKPEEPEKPSDFDNQPEFVKYAYGGLLTIYNRKLNEFNECVACYNGLQRAKEDGRAAYRFLLDRQYDQYEGFELVEAEEL